MKFFGKNNILSVSLDLTTLPDEIKEMKQKSNNYKEQLNEIENNVKNLEKENDDIKSKIIETEEEIKKCSIELQNIDVLEASEFSSITSKIYNLKVLKDEYNKTLEQNKISIEEIKNSNITLLSNYNSSIVELNKLEEKLLRKKEQMKKMTK